MVDLKLRQGTKLTRQKPENKKRARELDRDLRYLVLQTYSKRLSNSEIPCCKCCHLNTHIAFLAVDHIAGKKQWILNLN